MSEKKWRPPPGWVCLLCATFNGLRALRCKGCKNPRITRKVARAAPDTNEGEKHG